VVQEIFGVNAHIRAVTDKFASEGSLAVAPGIFERVEPKFEVGYDSQSRERGMATVGRTDREQMLRDVAAAIEVARQGGKVAVVGFCLGGTIAWAAAGRLPYPHPGVKEVAAAHPEVEVLFYPADHGFNCDHRESYDAPSAALAWTRTLAFLSKHLASG
jgi:carboxymethylenebutenolidase